MANNEKILSIKEVVAQLRAEGRLDEEKWKRFQRNFLFTNTLPTVFFVTLFIYLIITTLENGLWYMTIFFVLMIPYMAIRGYWFQLKEESHFIYCFNTGKSAKGKVISFLKTGSTPRNTDLIIEYTFLDSSGSKQTSKTRIPRSKCSIYNTIQNGDEIDIYYSKNDPTKSTAFVSPYSNDYFISKGDNNGE